MAAVTVDGPPLSAVTAHAADLTIEPAVLDSTVRNSPPQKFEVVVPPRQSSADEFQTFPEVEVTNEVIEPAYYYENMGIPVFTPTMDQFRDFRGFVDKINHHGMRSGIVKIIPPKEWRDSLPPLDDKVKDMRIKNPIEQHIAGVSGEYRQDNLEKQRAYNLPQWRQVCESSDHQPPARRGEGRRRGYVAPQAPKRVTRSRRSVGATKEKSEDPKEEADDTTTSPIKKNPPTPKSPGKTKTADVNTPEPVTDGFGRQPRKLVDSEFTPEPVTDEHGRQPRKKARKSAKVLAAEREVVDGVLFDGFDYRIEDADEYTPERCEELEKAYWRTLTYNSPLYGADMPGSLFDDTTTSWNVAKLPNLLDCLGKKLPGVNTAYLYLGMWKATFSWHLEDMDLYSINYIHFGAPKQWYSISRKDKEKFEQVMKGIWPNDAKKCSQFLRHKNYLVSPSLLAQHGIKVNKLVHHEGEFVITFPYGYHSGYNLGYNCAESVNFAIDDWLKYGRYAKRCECVGDSVWVDVEEIERKLRGEPTDDESSEDEYDYYDYEPEPGTEQPLPTPPESVEGKRKRRRKHEVDRERKQQKRRKERLPPAVEPCILCPNDIPSEELLPLANGHKAHRLCAIYTPETYFVHDEALNCTTVANIDGIPKARLDLRCTFCRSAKGSCFQCSAKKCTRAYHATCAAAAGVAVNMVDVNVIGEDGKEYPQTNIDYRCKFHRPKRPKNIEVDQLEEDPLIRSYSKSLIKGDVIQMQYLNGDIFAGVMLENRQSEEMILVELLPKGGELEVEWKWILAQDPNVVDFPEAITTAPLFPNPNHPPLVKVRAPAKHGPQPDETFGEPGSGLTWAELIVEEPPKNVHQEPVKQWWYYLGELSTEYISKYSEDPAKRVPNEAANFIAPKVAKPKVLKVPARSKPQLQHQYVSNTTKYPYYYSGMRMPQSSPSYPPQSAWNSTHQQLPSASHPPMGTFIPPAAVMPNRHVATIAPTAQMRAPTAPMASMNYSGTSSSPVMTNAPQRRPSIQSNGFSPGMYNSPQQSRPSYSPPSTGISAFSPTPATKPYPHPVSTPISIPPHQQQYSRGTPIPSPLSPAVSVNGIRPSSSSAVSPRSANGFNSLTSRDSPPNVISSTPSLLQFSNHQLAQAMLSQQQPHEIKPSTFDIKAALEKLAAERAVAAQGLRLQHAPPAAGIPRA